MTQLFIKEYDKDKNDLISVSKKYGEKRFDPFVGCCWDWENASALIGQWIEIENEWIAEDGAILVDDGSCEIKVMPNASISDKTGSTS